MQLIVAVFALYTATWGLTVPGLADVYPGNRRMAVQACTARARVTSPRAQHPVLPNL